MDRSCRRQKTWSGEDDGLARQHGEGTAETVSTIHCYFCAAGQPDVGRPACAVCGRTLQLSPALVTFGRAYLLNSLDGLIATGALDALAADRIREIVVSELETTTARSVKVKGESVGASVVVSAPVRPNTLASRQTRATRS